MKLSKIIFGKWAFRKVYSIGERRKPINKALLKYGVLSWPILPWKNKNVLFHVKKYFSRVYQTYEYR